MKRFGSGYEILMTRPVHKQARVRWLVHVRIDAKTLLGDPGYDGSLPSDTVWLKTRRPLHSPQLALYELALSHRSVGSKHVIDLEDVDRSLRTTAQGGQVRLLSVGEEVHLGKTTIVPHRAGRTLGGSVWRISSGEHTVVYAPDFSPRNESAVDRCVLPSEGAGGVFGRAALLVTAAYPQCADAVRAIERSRPPSLPLPLTLPHAAAAAAAAAVAAHDGDGAGASSSSSFSSSSSSSSAVVGREGTLMPAEGGSHLDTVPYVPEYVRDQDLSRQVRRVLRRGGDVLFPVESASRAVEILRRLHGDWDGTYSLVALGRLAKHAIRYAALHLECAARSLADRFNDSRQNPFLLPQVKHVATAEGLKSVPRPMVVVSSWPSLDRGAGHRFLPAMLPNPASCIFLTEPPRPGTTAAALATMPRPSELVFLRRFRRRRTAQELEEHKAVAAREAAALENREKKERAERALQRSLDAAGTEAGDGDDGNAAGVATMQDGNESGSGAGTVGGRSSKPGPGRDGAIGRGPGRF